MPRQVSNADDIRHLITALNSDIAHITQVATNDEYYFAQLKRMNEHIDELVKARDTFVAKREKCDEMIERRRDRIAVLTRQLSLETNKGELNKLAAKIAKFEKMKAKQ